MNVLKRNLAILSLSNNYSREIGKKIADNFDMFFVDLNDLMEYNLINDNMIEVAGREYFEGERTKLVKSLSQYENSLVVGDLELFFEQNNIVYLKNNYIVIYLHFDKKSLVKYEKNFEIQRNLSAFLEEDKICEIFKDIKVDVFGDIEKDIESVKNSLQKYLANFV